MENFLHHTPHVVIDLLLHLVHELLRFNHTQDSSRLLLSERSFLESDRTILGTKEN